MKKLMILIILVISGFMINFNYVNAATMEDIGPTAGSGSNPAMKNNPTSGEDCGVLGDPNDSNTFAFYLQKVFDIIRFLGPVLVLVMTIIDLVKVTAEQKQDGEIQKIGVKTLKRFIFAVLIFALPTLITSIFHLIGLYGTCVS